MIESRSISTTAVIGIVVAGAAAIALIAETLAGGAGSVPRLYFFDVGEGDASLAVFPSGATVLIDAGPDTAVTSELDRVLGGRRSIDIAVISHPQKDHFGGFLDLVGRYRIGAFLINGRNDDNDTEAWQTLLQKINNEHIPLLRVAAGDSVSVGSSTLSFLAPDPNYLMSGELNDTALVAMLAFPGFRALFTADMGAAVEGALAGTADVRADVLKVAHHGSKFSSTDAFLRAVAPRLAVISVGAKNTYGHPSVEALSRIMNDTAARVIRTDESGTIGITVDAGMFRVFASRTAK